MSASLGPLELPRGLVLNAFRIICPGIHHVVQFPRPASRQDRLTIEHAIGRAIFESGIAAYAPAGSVINQSEPVAVNCSADRLLHLFDLRGWLSEHAQQRKLRVRFGFAGELQITGFTGDSEVDGLRVERRLRLRVADHDLPQLETWLVVRHDTRYLVATTLADGALRLRCIGEQAERLTGDGPQRGEIVAQTERTISIRSRDAVVEVDPADYTLSVGAPYIRRYHSPSTLARLQTISGSLTATGHKNRYAVKDRYQMLAEAMEQLGWSIPMPAGEAVIERAWTEIRIQEADS
jgi:hypothetical protein